MKCATRKTDESVLTGSEGEDLNAHSRQHPLINLEHPRVVELSDDQLTNRTPDASFRAGRRRHVLDLVIVEVI